MEFECFISELAHGAMVPALVDPSAAELTTWGSQDAVAELEHGGFTCAYNTALI